MAKENDLARYAEIADELPFLGPKRCEQTVRKMVLPKVPTAVAQRIKGPIGIIQADEECRVYKSHTVAVTDEGVIIDATLPVGQRVYQNMEHYRSYSPTWKVED
jgi:hypothetical protein